MKIPAMVYKIVAFVVAFLFLPTLLIFIGYRQIHPLFSGEFTQHFGSIEVSYITMASFIAKSLPQFSWQPNWYFGYPMDLLYTPLVPFFEFVAHQLTGWSFSHAYRVLTAGAYIAGLVSLYLFARTLFKNTVAGFFTAISYGILPSLIGILFPEVAQDRFASIVEPRRFTILVRWGEGPHIVSLFFLPLAAWCWIVFLRRGSKWQLFFGAVVTALVALTNSVGAWGLLLLFFALFIEQLAVKTGNSAVSFKRAVIFGCFSFALIAFWYNPLFLSSFFREGGGSLGYWMTAFPWSWLGGLIVLLSFYFICRKFFSKIQGATGSILFFSMLFGLVYIYYASGNNRIELVPQVLRLTTEVDMGSSLLIGLLVAVLAKLLMRFHKWAYYAGMLIVLFGSAPFFLRNEQLGKELPKFAASAQAAGKNLHLMPEYEIARKLEEKVSGWERVLVPGNYSFYLNYFTDIPQLRGALVQSVINPWAEHIYFQVANGKDAEISLALLKIANIGWLVYSTRDIFHDYKVGAEKFDRVLELDEEINGDRIYQVPLKNPSLSKAVSKGLLTVPVPHNAIDEKPIFRYLDLLENEVHTVDIKQIENGRYRITGTTGTDEIILVQMSYAAGWYAHDSLGRSVTVQKDPLGFIALTPKGGGTQDITLERRKTWRQWFGYNITVTGGVLLLTILVRSRRPLFSVK